MSLNMLIEFGDAFDYTAPTSGVVRGGGLQALRRDPPWQDHPVRQWRTS